MLKKQKKCRKGKKHIHVNGKVTQKNTDSYLNELLSKQWSEKKKNRERKYLANDKQFKQTNKKKSLIGTL